MQTEVRQSLVRIGGFGEEQLRLVEERLQVQSCRKNDYWLEPPRICRGMAFIVSGSFRLFNRTAEKEHTLHFFTEGHWLCDFESFIGQQPSVNHIQAMERAEVASLTLWDIHELIALDNAFLLLGKLMKGWAMTTNHYTSMVDDNPDARYRTLLQTHPDWILRFPQRHLATYLGMSRETFSRVRRRNLSAPAPRVAGDAPEP